MGCFSPVGLHNIVDIQIRKYHELKCIKMLFKRFKSLKFLTKQASFMTMNACKIEAKGPRNMELGLK